MVRGLNRRFGCTALVLGASCACGAPVALAATNPVTAVPVSALEGQQFSGEVGTVANCSPRTTTANVDWGDGTPSSPATVTLPSGTTCEITGTHTYSEEGSYLTTITVSSTPAAGPSTATSTATVADAPLTLTGETLTGTAGTQTTGVVASLQDAGGLELGSDYTASINWGDGNSSPGTVGAGGSVSGDHTYTAPGTYSLTVTATDDGGQTSTATGHATIAQPSPPPCAATPPSAAPPFTPNAGSPDPRWVQAVYHDLLGRSADPAGLAQLTAALTAGATREEVVSFLEGDPDRPIIIGSLFSEYLHRAASPSELTYWAQFLATGGTDEKLRAALIGSEEYLTTRGGGTTPGFLGSLYCDVLGRALDPGDQQAWEQALGAGTSREQVALDVLSSAEYRGDLVRGLYLRFLRRTPSASELATWIGTLQSGATDEQVIAALLSSQEYFNHFSGGGTFVNPAITGLGVIHVTLLHPATLELRVLELLPAVQRRATATRLIAAPRTRLLGTVALGRHHKGRVTIHWNRKVRGRRLKRGRYALVLEARSGKRVSDVSDAIVVRVR